MGGYHSSREKKCTGSTWQWTRHLFSNEGNGIENVAQQVYIMLLTRGYVLVNKSRIWTTCFRLFADQNNVFVFEHQK